MARKTLPGTARAFGPVAAVVAALALAGCGRVEPMPEPPAASAPPPTPSVPAPNRPLPIPSVSSSGVFPEYTAAPCAGRPTGEQVVAALRRDGKLPSAGAVRVTTGPLCAGQWQYTVVSVTGREPLQVVTRGLPSALMVVTAGTQVCTDEIVMAAPRGIVTAAGCQ